MAPAPQGWELIGAYSEGLLAYLTEGGESSLERARELGRNALANGIRASDLHAVHHESVRQILSLMQNDECDECENSQFPMPCDEIHNFLRSLTAADAVAAAGT
jgi:hypothetical protein